MDFEQQPPGATGGAAASANIHSREARAEDAVDFTAPNGEAKRSPAGWAAYYTDALGFALVPIPPGSKGPRTRDWPNQAITDPAAARAIWNRRPDHGMGVVLGRSGLVSLDVDAVEHARTVLAEFGIDLDALATAAPTIQGHPDRFRVMFRAPVGVELSRRALAWPRQSPDGKPTTVFELRAGDVQDVLPPTVHPGTNAPYAWLRAPWDLGGIPPLPPDLLELWRSWEAYKPELEGLCPWAEKRPEPPPRRRSTSDRPDIIGAFNQAHDVRALLEAHGYQPKGRRYLAPTSTSGMPAVVVLESGRVYSHHGADPLADGHSHDAFDVIRILEHGGDQRAALRAAATTLGMEYDPGDASRRNRATGREQADTADGDRGGEWPDPEPLPNERPAVPAFDTAMLPDPLSHWIQDIAERMQCPVEFPAVAVMAMCGALIGRRIGIRPKRFDDWTEVPNLWGGVIGRPGTLKSPALKEALRPLRRLAANALEEHRRALAQYELDRELSELQADVAKAEARKAAKTSKLGEAKEALRRARQQAEPDKPPERRYETNDSTVEKLGELLRDNPDGLLVFRDELAGWLSRLDQEGREADRAFYLEAWSGLSGFVYDRIGRGTVKIDKACIAILGGIQPGVLADYVAAACTGGAGADGLLQRFQLLVWPDDPGRWRNVDRWPNKAAREAAYETVLRLDGLEPLAIGAQPAEDESGVPYLRFDPDAQHVFDQWRDELEQRLRDDDHPEAFEAHLAKYRKLVPALALLIHLIETGTGPVSEVAMLKAAAWSELLEAHARRVYAAALHPEIAAAHRLAAKLLAGKIPEPFTARDVYRPGWRGLNREQTTAALRELTEACWLRPEKIAQEGRPKIQYWINPAIRKQP